MQLPLIPIGLCLQWLCITRPSQFLVILDWFLLYLNSYERSVFVIRQTPYKIIFRSHKKITKNPASSLFISAFQNSLKGKFICKWLSETTKLAVWFDLLVSKGRRASLDFETLNPISKRYQKKSISYFYACRDQPQCCTFFRMM